MNKDMDKELTEVKSALRSLVVSCSTNVDVRSLLRDYKNIVGGPLPITKFGYRDPVEFLKERCSDCFLFSGPNSNPVLTLIVPKPLEHIDKFVRKQRVASKTGGGKRLSVLQRNTQSTNLILETFNNKCSITKSHNKPREASKPHIDTTPNVSNVSNSKDNKVSKDDNLNSSIQITNTQEHCPDETKQSIQNNNLHNFLKKRLPCYMSSHALHSDTTTYDDKASSKGDDDSGRQTMSSKDSARQANLEELKDEIHALVKEHPDGVWSTDIIRLYRERYGCEVNFSKFGHTSIVSLVYGMEDRLHVWRPQPAGDWRVADARVAPPARVAPSVVPRVAPRVAPRPADDEALPGVEFDADVFPADCVHFMESVPGAPLAGVRAGRLLEVMVGEVYSPSHFWIMRLGDQYDVALEEIMDEMNEYYGRGAGQARRLAAGAVRAGQYCAALYDGHWHRALVVARLDDDWVKVRHVDYGTVERAPAAGLKPLLRRWARLPAQALRARLAGVRPSAGGRRWPHAAALHFLRLVSDRRLVAGVLALDADEDAAEVSLVDTSGDEDVDLARQLVRAGHADPARAAPAPAAPAPVSARDDDELSDVSASASELVGCAPRRLPPWEPGPAAVRLAALRRRTAAPGPPPAGSSPAGSPPRALSGALLRRVSRRAAAPAVGPRAPSELSAAPSELSAAPSELSAAPSLSSAVLRRRLALHALLRQ